MTDTNKERDAFKAYLRDCDGNAIVPDVGGAWHAAFQAGRASIAAGAGSEPVATIKSWTNGSYWRNYNVVFHRDDLPVGTDLYTHPSPPEGMVLGLQVYRCKIKSRKQIDREIPRELQGWWADVAAGQKLLLRQAVQSDLDRCNLGGKRSRNPADYMCETHTGGSLVSKAALEYMNPEENVFAAPQPAVAAGWMPIETAPKHESVLLYSGGFTPIYCGRRRYGLLGEPQQDVLAWRCDSSGRFANPTRWLPLPPAPSSEGESNV